MKDRAGVAIPLVLVFLLAGTALAHAALLMARAERRAAGVRVESVVRRAAAELAGARTLAHPPDPAWRHMDIWDDRVVPDSVIQADARVTLRRLAPEAWWMEATPRTSGAGAPGGLSAGRIPGASVSRLLWWMDPVARVAGLGAVVTVGRAAPVELGGLLDVSTFGTAPSPAVPAICRAAVGDQFDGITPDGVAMLPSGIVRPGLGLIPFDTVLGRTGVRVDGSGTPVPRDVLGTCEVADPWNWGDPERPYAPCGQSLVVRGATAPLRVEGGRGQGAWVVDGDLVLVDGARLYGFVLVTGMLSLEDSAEVHGAAVAVGGVRTAPRARLVGSACWAARGLAAAAHSWSPVPVPMPGVPLVGP